MRPPEFIATMTMMAFGFALVFPMVRAWARRIEAKDKVQALSPGANDPRLAHRVQCTSRCAVTVTVDCRLGAEVPALLELAGDARD